jgi:diguanylate cyclase (GGDEF)-like protein
LTDLPNHVLFLNRLEQALNTAARRRQDRRYGRVVAVLFIGLDNFKVISNSLGHHMGDELLGEVSRCICSCL